MQQEATTAALFTPLEEAVAAYFSGAAGGMAAALEDVVKYMYNDLTRRTTIFEFTFNMHCSENYPTGYADIRDCFYSFSALLSITNEQFYSGFVYESAESGSGDSESGGATVPTANTYVDSWVAEITAASAGDLANVQALAEWCKNSGGCSDLINLLENKGKVISQLTLRDKASLIYYDRKLLEVIRARGFAVYVPSYFEN